MVSYLKKFNVGIAREYFENYPLYFRKIFKENFYVGAAGENFENYPLFFWKIFSKISKNFKLFEGKKFEGGRGVFEKTSQILP